MMVRLGARLKKEKICASIKKLTAEGNNNLSSEKSDMIRQIVAEANNGFKANFASQLFIAIKKYIINAVINNDGKALACDKILTFVQEFIEVAVNSIARWEFSKIIFPEPRGVLTVREIVRTVKDALCEVESYAKIYSLLCRERRLGFTVSDAEILLYKYANPSLAELKILARHKEGLTICLDERNEMKSLVSLIRSNRERRVLKKIEAFIDRHADGSKSSIYALAKVRFDFISAFYSEIEQYEEMAYKRGEKTFNFGNNG
jgi:hypothetical protein